MVNKGDLEKLYLELAHVYEGAEIKEIDKNVVYIQSTRDSIDAIVVPPNLNLLDEIINIIKGKNNYKDKGRRFYFDFRECLVFMDDSILYTLHEKITDKQYLVLIKSWDGIDIIKKFLEGVRCGRKYYTITISF